MNEQIRVRVQKYAKNGRFSKSGCCLICGKAFRHDSCPHSVTDQYVAIDAEYAERLLK